MCTTMAIVFRLSQYHVVATITELEVLWLFLVHMEDFAWFVFFDIRQSSSLGVWSTYVLLRKPEGNILSVYSHSTWYRDFCNLFSSTGSSWAILQLLTITMKMKAFLWDQWTLHNFRKQLAHYPCFIVIGQIWSGKITLNNYVTGHNAWPRMHTTYILYSAQKSLFNTKIA